MKKLLSLFLCATVILGLIGCGDNQDKKDTVKDNIPDTKNKLYKTGDTVSYTDENGNDAFSLTIDSVSLPAADDTAIEEFPDGEQVVTVTYTYVVHALPDEGGEFMIPPALITVSNESKNVTTHSFARMSDTPNGVGVGYSETAKGYYGIKGENSMVYITYKSRDFEGNYEFECEIK